MEIRRNNLRHIPKSAWRDALRALQQVLQFLWRQQTAELAHLQHLTRRPRRRRGCGDSGNVCLEKPVKNLWRTYGKWMENGTCMENLWTNVWKNVWRMEHGWNMDGKCMEKRMEKRMEKENSCHASTAVVVDRPRSCNRCTTTFILHKT